MRRPLVSALLAAAIATMVLPGGIALSNYSGPYAKTVTLGPPWAGATQERASFCMPLDTCRETTHADAGNGRLESGVSLATPLDGAGPSIGGSGVYARSVLRIDDPFEDGASADSTLYRVYVHINRVTDDRKALTFALAPRGETYLVVEGPQGAAVRELFPDDSPNIVIELGLAGPVEHGVSLRVALTSDAYAPFGSPTQGKIRSEADVTVTKVVRIY